MGNSHLLYSRIEDGSKPVLIEKSGDSLIYKVDDRSFSSARQLLINLTGSKNWAFDKYFRQGKYKLQASRFADLPQNQPSLNILELPTMAQVAMITSPMLSVQTSGIDLAKRGHEVAKLFYAGFAGKLVAAGIDPEEVLQEVYRGILVRNQGMCPWDPAKSSFGHYVHMVCGCIISNYFRHENRKNAMEQTGIRSRLKSEEGMVDVGSDNAYVPGILDVDDTMAMNDLLKYLKSHGTSELRTHPEVLMLMREGCNRLEISRRTRLPVAQVSRIYKGMQDIVLRWSEDIS